jgi:hypothetical protein
MGAAARTRVVADAIGALEVEKVGGPWIDKIAIR